MPSNNAVKSQNAIQREKHHMEPKWTPHMRILSVIIHQIKIQPILMADKYMGNRRLFVTCSNAYIRVHYAQKVSGSNMTDNQ